MTGTPDLTDPVDRGTARETERVRAFFDRSAASYDGWMRPFDRLLLGDGRAQVCSRARGRTLEIAAGTGFRLSPSRFARVTDMT